MENSKKQFRSQWTTFGESCKLVAAGLPKETADMWYDLMDGDEPEDKIAYLDVDRWLVENNETHPCWSLGSLMILLPKIKNEDEDECYPIITQEVGTSKWHCIYAGISLHTTNRYNTPIEAVIDMILWLLENNVELNLPTV